MAKKTPTGYEYVTGWRAFYSIELYSLYTDTQTHMNKINGHNTTLINTLRLLINNKLNLVNACIHRTPHTHTHIQYFLH